MSCNWSELPPDLLTSIGKRLDNRIDVLRFRSICSSWRSSLPFGTWPPRLPLTLPFPIIPHRYPHPRGHYTFTQATVYRLQPLHNPSDSRPKAWIIKGGHISIKIGVNRVQKAVFLNNFTVVALHSDGELAVLRLGDERWTPLVGHQHNSYRDLINFKGKVYATNLYGESLIIDSSLNIRVFSSFESSLNNPVGDKKHLVESCGELWLLDRNLRGLSHNVWHYPDIYLMFYMRYQKKEIWFKASKLNEEEQKWVEVPDLGDRILFAGRDCSFSVSATDFEGCNCKGNCVFFMNSCSNFHGNYHDDYDALRGSDGEEPEIYHIGDHCLDQLVAYPGYADLFWPLPSWLASGSSSSSQS
ncbi:hypothetical protein Vadar_005855 [Vaccinium darrowii]|uniref:Uncharacterized protein n=1 Tax=Vaccinium darrowii TaxID=229202 RepID=A0ACB7Y534_9ERIC|nr:hypothetical protein Vadar_005855 [Vaccinium darrowii]